jgi:hypothetical protein
VALDPRLLELLICPDCHGNVRPTEGEEAIECLACGLLYPVRDGIPIMLVEEATRRSGESP